MSNSNLPRKILDLNKAAADQAMANTTTALKVVGKGVKTVVDASRTAGKIVVGQSRSAVERTVAAGTKGAKEVAGQVRAQGDRVGKSANRATNQVVDTATRAVSDMPSSGTPYEHWTKAQLVERAQEMDVPGRATMNKAELIDALRD